jgi:hypothetical protein
MPIVPRSRLSAVSSALVVVFENVPCEAMTYGRSVSGVGFVLLGEGLSHAVMLAMSSAAVIVVKSLFIVIFV